MRTVLLIRHAPVDCPDGARLCLGSRTDLPASPAGLAAAAALAPVLRKLALSAVCHSPMRRCRETAEALAAGLPVESVPGLEEIDCGLWDGLSFDAIRARWPEHYARRGEDPALPPPGGEAYVHAAARGLAALRKLLARTEGDLAVVAHAGVNRAMLTVLAGMPIDGLWSLPQEHLCVNSLSFDGTRLSVVSVGKPLLSLAETEGAVTK